VSPPSRDQAPAILVISHVVPFPPTAGNEIRILKMLTWLRAEGYRIVLLLNHERLGPERQRDLQPVADAVHYVSDDYGVAFPALRPSTTAVVSGRLAAALPDSAAYRAIFGMSKAKKLRYEGVKRYLGSRRLAQVARHLCDTYTPAAVLAEYIFTAPCLDVVPPGAMKIIDTHDMFSRKQEQVLSHGIDDPLPCRAREERHYLLKADVIIAIQPHEARLFRQLVPEREVITTGIDFDVVDEPDDSAIVPGRILLVGSDNVLNQHGLTWFLERVWPAVRAAYPAAMLRVVGKLANHVHGNDPRIEAAGWVADLDDEYRLAHVVINSTLAGTGLKIKSVEALCRGKALVGTRNSVEGIESGGEPPYVVAEDPDRFAAAIVELLSSHERRRALERRAVAFAKATCTTDHVYAPLRACLGRAFRRDPGDGRERPPL
jgi:glycosyltransferase involved in cell wall biosynthesis